MDTFAMVSLLMAVCFAFGAFQMWNGKTDFVGSMAENIKPELKKQYCREMSMPMMFICIIELIDFALNFVIDGFGSSQYALMLLVIGLGGGILWVALLQRKYNKKNR